MLKSLLVVGSLLGVLAVPVSSHALERVPYDIEAVAAAQERGDKIILGIWAVWCATCQSQIAILDGLADDPRFAGITVFHIDYDRQKPVMRLIGASVRSQMIAFDGDEEIGRLIADTNADRIEAFLLALAEH